MTIKVEQEALLRVLSRQPLLQSSSTAPSSPSSSRLCAAPIPDEEFVIVDIPKSLAPIAEDRSGVKQRNHLLSLLDDVDHPQSDDPSICTVSTDSLSTDSESISRRVSFAAPLVTEEWTRPWTLRDDVPLLYYSTEETTRFRQEYRLERKVLSELSLDPEDPAVETDGLTGLFTTSPTNKANRHHISRVVVLHNDKIETFFSPDTETETTDVPQEPVAAPKLPAGLSGDFFDNDSFWSGSLTWY